MKKCKKCGKEFEPQKGLVNYCSLKCRNSRDWSEEDKKKKSESAKKSDKIKAAGKLSKERMIKLHEDFFPEFYRKRNEIRKKEILSADFSTLKFKRLKDRLFYEQDGRCNKCGNHEWLGEPIALELEHKDGNNKNNNRENLELLCPNCHAQTETWRGRNSWKGKRKNKVEDDVLLNVLINNNWNFYQSLVEVNLSPKGGNYKRCHKLKREYDEIVGATGFEPVPEN